MFKINIRLKPLSLLLIILLSTALYSDTAEFARFEQAKSSFKKGTAFFNDMKYLSAVEHFRTAISIYPDYKAAREYLARSYRLAGYTGLALREWESLVSLNPDNNSAASKIEALRFRGAALPDGDDFASLVLSSAYRSREFKRFSFANPVDFTFDSEKNIYISSFTSGKIIKIDINGKAVEYFSPSYDGKIFGLDSAGKLIAASDFKNNKVFILNSDGKKILEAGSTGSADGSFHGPKGVSLAEDGYLFVVDSGNNRVQKFSTDGKFILKFGSRGEYEGELENPTDAAYADGFVYVTDTGNKRVTCYDRHGNFAWNDKITGLEMPRGITASGGNLFVADERKGLLVYNLNSGASEWYKKFDGDAVKFSRLYAAAPDRDGYLYCLDYNRETLFVLAQTKARYTNLDIEITSVDASQFPVIAFYANVRGRDGRPVYGLTKENFTVTEDSARMGGVYSDYLKRARPSVSMVFCVDRSPANRENHKSAAWAADFILSSMKKNDRARIINFSGTMSEGNRFDWSRRRALKAVREDVYSDGKAIGTALYSSISDLVPAINRRGIILITDGTVEDDSFSAYAPEVVIDYARAHYIPVYIISFKKPDEILSRIARETGGAVVMAHQTDSLKAVYAKIKDAEEYRYVLAYSTFKLPSFKGWWSNVKIEIDYKSQKGVEWGGYFVP